MAPITTERVRPTSRADAPRIHPSAVIHPRAVVGAGVQIGPYCVVGANVTIGARTELRGHVVIEGPTTIGEDNVVFPFAVLGADPQDLKYQGEKSELVIGDRNSIREHATIHRGTELGGWRTSVGDDNLIMVSAHIAHDCVLENETVIANNVMLAGHCRVEEGAVISGGVGAHHFTTIGRFSFIGGMARVVRDVPPFIVFEGQPAEPRKINSTALARRDWSVEDIKAVKSAFKALFRSPEAPVQETLDRLLADDAQPECVRYLCKFLDRSGKGIHGRWLESLRTRGAPLQHSQSNGQH